MKPRTDRVDPWTILALLGAALLFTAWRLGSTVAPDRLLASIAPLAPPLAPLALGAVAIASALASQRLLTTRRTLRSRRVLALVPADEFDPAPGAVLGFAAQLARSRRVVGGWLDRPASAIRVCLTGDGEGRLVYLLEVPERAYELLRSALRSYPGVELRDANDAIGEEGAAAEGATVRAELVLGRPSVEPLARLGPDPDPLGAFAAAIAGLRSGERASVCLDLLPAAGHRRTRLRRRLRRQAHRLHGRRRGWADLLGERRSGGRPEPEELVERRQIGQALDAKLREAGSLFEAQVLVRCQADGRRRAKILMRSLLAAFEPFAERNWLRVSGLAIPGLAFLGSDLPVRRARFDRRERTGLFRPARQTILTGREIAAFLKPPTARCPAENVLRSGALLAPPPALPDFDAGREDLIPLGRVTDEEGERVVAVRAADTFFSYVAGRSRFGKTETAIAQFVHLARTGHGCLFLDPHADALERIAPYLATPELARRVVRIDLGPGSGDAAQPGWNLFELRGRSAEEAEGRVEAVVDAFASALEWGERSTRAINLTTQAVGALAAVARVLPAELAPTIFQLPTLLGDADWREAVLPFLPRAARDFWTDRFPLLAAEAITPLTNMVDRLRASTAISTLLGQSEGTYRVREAMDRGLIVLACPGAGGTRERLVANLLLFDLLHAARGRAALAPSARRPFWVFLDEVQSYDGAASGNLAALLEQSAKFGLRAVLLNQNPERLSAQTLNALTTNRSHLLATALNSHAAGLLTKEWGGQPSPAALTRLPRYRFIAQVTHRGELSRPFALGGITAERALGEPPRACESRAHAVACREPAAVLGHLETLDPRIHADLGRRRRAAAKKRSRGGHTTEAHAGEGSRAGKVRVARSRP
jgi:hypothetical protein